MTTRSDPVRRRARRVVRALAAMLLTLGAASAVPRAAFASGWSALPSANAVGATNAMLRGVSCVSPSSCFAVGYYIDSSGNDTTLAERWNGSSWTIQTMPDLPGAIRSALAGVSCPAANACSTVGDYVNGSGVDVTLAERWNGATWSIQPTPYPTAGGSLAGVSCAAANSCTAVGQSNGGSLAEGWNGNAWSIEATPTGAGPLAGVSCTAATACMAVGQSGNGALTEEWNGSAWTVEPTPVPVQGNAHVLSSSFSGVSCTTASDCIAVGRDYYFRCNLGRATCNCFQWPYCTYVRAALAEQWNGTAWQAQSQPAGAWELSSVSCTTANACMGVGGSAGIAGAAVAEQWNGASWQVQSTPSLTGGANLDAVSCTSAQVCEAVGQGTTATLAEGWNGNAWTVQSTPTPAGAYSTVLSGVSCLTATTCTATGHYVRASGASLTLAERWGGVAWSVQPSPTPPGATALSDVSCASANACMAVGPGQSNGAAAAEQWDGTTWTSELTPTGAGQSLSGVSCTAANACIAVGDYSNGTQNVTLAEQWDGTMWSTQPTPNPAGTLFSAFLYGVSCSTPTSCTAVGEANDPTDVTLAEQWDGAAWSIQPTPNPAGETVRSDLLSVSCTAPDACTAVGFGQNTGVGLVERWDGGSWTIEPTPNPGGPAFLTGVSCTTATACTAVGYYRNGTHNTALAEQWNGSSWSIALTPALIGASQSILSGVSCTAATTCVAVGDYVNASGIDVTLAESYTG